ncbi:pseudouridine synthase [Lentibacillus sp. CBA3610]|uniref:pseudouridine synthase n=1 Tax=Lentibacillus sp. CBA3610 TaxID=2518176 RepID=UPI001595429E|nr:pseudouridine synthase [Lentibacillus sp. CBA3610]QKY69745.1 rRNA pseudouridine synthase [Lentibacillus sp. CBA3610]
MRLDKLLANKGYGSRKDVKALIKKKKVSVNEKIVKDSSSHVNPENDSVKVNNEMVHYQAFVYIMMNKPPGYVSATVDARDKTVIDLLPDAYKRFNPFPVGRLDKDTEGLLLITNDGELGHSLTSPKKGIEKTYYADIEGHVTEEDVEQFERGIQLNDGYTAKPATLDILRAGRISQVHVILTEGKFHQVKRMFEAIGKKVVYLKRVQMGNLKLDSALDSGEFRELTNDEIDSLKNDVQKKS